MRLHAALASTFVAGIALAGCATAPKIDARASLVDAERAFARMSVERGLRDAFLANFADDGIAFEPAPVRLRETWAAPPPAGAKSPLLDWHPVIAGVSRSGTLGFTSGPFTLADASGARPATHGVYFSVWRRGADGVWKVAADAGIRTPEAVSDAALLPEPVLVPPSDAAVETLDAADASASGDPAAFAERLADDARWQVDGRAPVIGRGAIAAARADGASTPLRFVTMGREVATSGELGFTYGRYDAGAVAAGYYLHVWNRDRAKGWRLVVAVHLAS